MATSSDGLKQQIDANITSKTEAKSISPADVGNNMKAVVDYADQIVAAIPFKVQKTRIGYGALYTLATTPIVLLTNPAGTKTVKIPVGYYMIREFGEFYNNFENVAVHMKYGSTIGPIVGMVNTDAFEDEVSGFSQGMWATSYTNYPVNQALYPDSYVLKAAANFNTGYGDMVLYLFYIEVPL